MLEARKLSKLYHPGDVEVRALNGVDFHVGRGEFVAIMGPSGSGKSTLMHLLGGLDRPSDGDIVLDGKTLNHLDDTALTILRRREIGFIFQFFNLIPTLTAFENVALPLMLDGQSVDAQEARIRKLLAMVGLADREKHKPHQLSGGQQQRVAIARALVTEPKLVLADEPTGNLDSTSGRAIMTLMRQTCDEKQQTIVMVTHDNRAAAIADKVVFLKDGSIVQNIDFTENRDTRRTQEILAVTASLEM